MSESTSTRNGGIGFLGLLTIVFIVLKLTHYINWSWFWVLLPMFIIPAFFFILSMAMFIFSGVLFGIAFIGDKINASRRKRKIRSKQ